MILFVCILYIICVYMCVCVFHQLAETVVRGEALEVSGGGFVDTYRLNEFHFHWGQDSSRGSEHTINGKAYPLEVRALAGLDLRFPYAFTQVCV